MYAMIFDENRDFVWREVPDPVRGEDEVLIAVHAAALNRADLMQKDGKYASPEGWPDWCGLEVAGEVLEAPAGSGFAPGARVCALLGGGGYSEMVSAPAGMVVPVPDGLSMVEGASLPEVWATVYLNLQMEAGGLNPGEVCYIQAAASGVGLAAIQYVKLMGGRVIASVGTPEKAEFVRNLGADYVINYKTEDALPLIKAHPPSIALDCVGGQQMGACLREMAFGGRWIMIASLAGGETTIDLEPIWRKRIRLIGSTLRSRTNQEKTQILSALHQNIWPLFSSGKLITHIHETFPITQAQNAHNTLRQNQNIGKVVLLVRS